MPRSPRLPFTGLPLHVVQRGNDRQRSFHDDSDYQVYLQALREAAKRHHVLVHAYVLMTNHVHLLLTAATDFGISRAMQSIGSRYVRYFNRRHERTGTLWEGRYKACLVASDEHLLAACRYIDLNPVRAGIVQHPLDYPWSSYQSADRPMLCRLRHAARSSCSARSRCGRLRQLVQSASRCWGNRCTPGRDSGSVDIQLPDMQDSVRITGHRPKAREFASRC